jgi:cyclohexa-1,5-dienecarbonyl-CoA hydratase
VGVFPPIAAQIIPRIVGRKAAMELILSGKIISGQEAQQMGLVNRVVKREELEASTTEFVRPYLRLSAEVLRKTKKAIMAGLRDDFDPSLKIIEDIYLDELMKTEDANEGLKAFLEKRKPVWKNA